MDALALLRNIRSLGVDITITEDGERLRFLPGDRVPPELVPVIREHKPELMAALTDPTASGIGPLTLPDGWHESVAAWFRAGCPKGDPIGVGASMLTLRHLYALPPGHRATALRAWRAQLRERP